jgi:hypothetical protein
VQSAVDDLDPLGAAYLERLTAADLRALVRADGVPAVQVERRIAALRSQPALVLDVLDRPAVSGELVVAATAGTDSRQFTLVSPFLLFAAVLHRTTRDLAATTYTTDRSGPRLRVPVFDAASLATYLTPQRRLFLADLLTSYAQVRSGVVVTRTPRGLRRRRWSDLDPVRLASLLPELPEEQRVDVLRRLANLALFLTGVFPDHAARTAPGLLDTERLCRLTGLRQPGLGVGGADLLAWFGAQWYLTAAERTRASAGTMLRDTSEHFHQARRVLNSATDRYLFPVTSDWFAAG